MEIPAWIRSDCKRITFLLRRGLVLSGLLALAVAARASSVTVSVSTGFYNTAASSSQSGTFTATFDAAPSLSPSNAVIGLSKGTQTAYSGISCIARFNPSGDIDAYNGSGYQAASTIPYSAGKTYCFRMVVNVSAKTYSVYVTPPGSAEVLVGSNYGFRNAATSLDTWTIDVNSSPGGSITVSNLSVGSSQVAAPAFSPAAGTYTSAPSVAISSATGGASIRYTTDGSMPGETAGTLYAGPVSLGSTVTLQAIAYESGFADSAVSSGLYTVNVSAVATPTFSPAAGTYTSAQSVSLSDATSGATIYYTTNGSTPTTSSAVYGSPIPVTSGTVTINAMGVKSGMTNSVVGSAIYTVNISQAAAAPTFTPAAGTYTIAQTVTIASATSGASISYTTDGSTPTETHGTVIANNGTVAIGASATLQAIAFKSGYTDSTVASGAYTINLPIVATPAFSPAAGTYTSAQTVTITSATSGASIRYTTDGVTTPSETVGTLYSSAVSITTTTTLKAIAYKTGFTDSTVASGTYTINLPQVAAPAFNPAGGTYTSAQSITISDSTSGAAIHFTTDGSTPTTSSPAYGSPIPITSGTVTIDAIGVKSGMTNSAVASGIYTINVPAAAVPLFTPSAGAYNSVQTVTITSATSGATIRYTTDGTTPSETNGNLYSGLLTLGSTTTLKAIAYETGLNDSPVTSGSYVIDLPQAAAPSFSPGGGTYTSAQTVTITSSTGAAIRYTTDGSTPSETAGALYSSPVNISSTATLKAIAFANGFSDSGIASATYTINYPPPPPPPAVAPVFSPVAGTYSAAQSVTMTSSTNGASIRYTTDGSTPTETNGTVYSGAVSLGNTAMLKAIAYKTGLSDSAVTKGLYTITSSPAVVLNVLYDFVPGGNSSVVAPLAQGADGNFYGATADGGTGYGSIFKITPAGALTTLIAFNGTNGELPNGLVAGSDGNLYGTTEQGVFFKMTTAGVMTTLASFNGASGPAFLVQGNDGNFYGVSAWGGNGDGAIFKVTSAGSFSILADLPSPEPTAALVQGNDGNFYGTTSGNGNGVDGGTTFSVAPSGALTTLDTFVASLNAANGFVVEGSLVQASDGNFYGTTMEGGSTYVYDSFYGDGTAFKMTPSGTLTNLASFTGANGAYPNGLMLGRDSNFYGVTRQGGNYGNGVIFSLTPAGTLQSVVSFDGPNGKTPVINLVQGSDGNFYGATDQGGAGNAGVIFQLIPVPLPAASTPAFSPATGTYTSTPSVTITSATNGATIRYTTDGSTPSEGHGTVYTGPVSLNRPVTLKAIAYASGLIDSVVASGTYTINLPTASAPAFSPVAGTYMSVQTVTITSATSGASIAYTTDGTTPTESNGTVANGALYSGPITVSATTTLTAIAFENGFIDSAVTGGAYTINLPTASAPEFSPVAGIYTSVQTVAITSTTAGALIAYTTDGTTPAESNGTVTHGALYSGPLTVSNATVLKAIAFGTEFIDSAVTGGTYTINLPTASAPAFSPAAGTYVGAQTVTIASTTAGASIAYTTDGTVPAENNGTVTHGALYSNPVNLSAPTVLKAIAFQSGFIDSAVTGGTYMFTPPAASVPAFSPAGGAYTGAQKVAITSTTGGASIAYTTDGSTPAESGGAVTHGTLLPNGGSVTVGATATLNAIAFKNGFVDSAVEGATYVINIPPPPAAPTFSPVAGTYTSAQAVSISTVTSGASIIFTTDGSIPTESNGTLYARPVNIANPTMLKAIAYQSGSGDSPITSGLYTIGPPAASLNVICNLTAANGGAGSPSSAGLVQGSDGNFYDTTCNGGSNNDGTVFAMTPVGALTTLVSFDGANGANPYAGLVQGSDGNFYGTTYNGGSNNNGAIFEMTLAGVVTPLISFDGANGSGPSAVLVQGSDGSFYGKTSGGGGFGQGVVFQLTLPQAAMPGFSLPGGAYSGPQSVTISAAEGATVVYTTDGTMPSETNGIVVPGGETVTIVIKATTTLRAVTYEPGHANSPVTTAVYTISAPIPTLPQIQGSNGCRPPAHQP